MTSGNSNTGEPPDSTQSGQTNTGSQSQDGGQEPAEQPHPQQNQPVQSPHPQEPMAQTAQPVTYGESVTDIFSRPDTKPVIIQSIALFAALTGGMLLFSYFTVNGVVNDGDAVSGIGGTVVTSVIVLVAGLLGQLLAVVSGLRVSGLLTGVKDDLVYATAAVGTGIGQMFMMFFVILASTIPLPQTTDLGFSNFVSLMFLSAIAAAVVASLSVYLLRKVSDPKQIDN